MVIIKHLTCSEFEALLTLLHFYLQISRPHKIRACSETWTQGKINYFYIIMNLIYIKKYILLVKLFYMEFWRSDQWWRFSEIDEKDRHSSIEDRNFVSIYLLIVIVLFWFTLESFFIYWRGFRVLLTLLSVLSSVRAINSGLMNKITSNWAVLCKLKWRPKPVITTKKNLRVRLVQ